MQITEKLSGLSGPFIQITLFYRLILPFTIFLFTYEMEILNL